MVQIMQPNNKKFELVPEGVYSAYCYQFIDLGLQESKWGIDPKCILAFEIPELKIENAAMIIRTGEVKISFSVYKGKKSTLLRAFEALNGKPFSEIERGELIMGQRSLKEFVGKSCQIQVVHNESGENIYANIENYIALPKGAKLDSIHNELTFFDKDNPNPKIFENLPEYIKKKIMNTLKKSDNIQSDKPNNDLNDEIPW